MERFKINFRTQLANGWGIFLHIGLCLVLYYYMVSTAIDEDDIMYSLQAVWFVFFFQFLPHSVGASMPQGFVDSVLVPSDIGLSLANEPEI